MIELPKDLQRKIAKLAALEAGGVENWEFYAESLKNWRQENEKEETAESIVDEMLEVVNNYIEEPAGSGCGYSINSKGYEAAVAILLRRSKEFMGEEE